MISVETARVELASATHRIAISSTGMFHLYARPQEGSRVRHLRHTLKGDTTFYVQRFDVLPINVWLTDVS